MIEGKVESMNKSDISRNLYMLKGSLEQKGYDWWWHSFSGYNKLTGEQKTFFIEYFIMNPKLGGNTPVFGQLPENIENHRRPSYVMIKAGAWGENHKQLHAFYPISDLKINTGKLEISIANSYLSESKILGEVHVSEQTAKAHPEYMSDAGSMEWDLTVDKKVAFNVGYGASEFVRKLNAFEMFWHAEGMKTQYSGSVILDGVEYEVTPETSYGYADKNWGANYTSPWVWLSSCNMRSLLTGRKLENSVINIGGGRPKVFGVAMNGRLLIDFYYEGRDYEFNFSKFWTLSKTKFNCYETDSEIKWDIITQTPKYLLEIKSSCKKDEMLLINYEAPDGTKRHNRLWNGGTGTGILKLYSKKSGSLQVIDEIEMKNIGCEYGEYTE